MGNKKNISKLGSIEDRITSTYYFRDEANTATTAFCLRQEKDDQKVVLEDKDLEIIGAPIIKYGDSTVIVQHSETGLWLSYKVPYLNFCCIILFKISL